MNFNAFIKALILPLIFDINKEGTIIVENPILDF